MAVAILILHSVMHVVVLKIMSMHMKLSYTEITKTFSKKSPFLQGRIQANDGKRNIFEQMPLHYQLSPRINQHVTSPPTQVCKLVVELWDATIKNFE